MTLGQFPETLGFCDFVVVVVLGGGGEVFVFGFGVFFVCFVFLVIVFTSFAYMVEECVYRAPYLYCHLGIGIYLSF